MDPPEATDAAARPPRRRQRRHRMSSSTVSSRQRRFSTGKLAELILIFTICATIISCLYFFALQNNDAVQNQNINADKIIDLTHVLQESNFQRNNSTSVSPKLVKFCGHNRWKGIKRVSCDDRVSFLVKKYNVSEQQAKTELLEQPQQQCRCECPHFLTRREKTIPTPPQAAKTKKKRTLVIIMGNLRGTEKAWGTLSENVLVPNEADLALMIGDLPKEKRTSSLFHRAKYTWFFNEYDDWGRDVIDAQIMNGTAWRKILPPKNSLPAQTGLWGGVPGYKGSGLIIFAIRWFISMKIKDLGLQAAYDVFVITRSDHYYGCQHDISEFFDPSALWVPSGQEWGGFTDRHLVVGKDLVLKALDILPPFLGSSPHRWTNPEGVLKYIWEDVHGLSVKSFERVMFTVAGPTDTTRWRKPMNEIPCINGLRFKYIEEFFVTESICRNRFQAQEGQSQKAVAWEQIEEKNNTNTVVGTKNVSHASLCRFKDANMGLCHFIPYGNNFGDEIGPLVSKKLVEDHFNCKGDSLPVWNLAKKGARKGTCLFSLGSIFHMVKDGDHVWGTGVNPTWQRQVPGNLNIHAVRGPYTEDFLRARGVIKESVGHGDPGLLLPLMFPTSINRESENQFCFVAHAQDKDIVNGLAIQKERLSPEVHVIHAQARLPQVVESMLTCSHIASTSLHGLILADAFGIPSRWFQFPKSKTEKTEGHFKYQDYYSTIGRDNATHAEIFEDVFNTSTYWEIPAEGRRHDVVQALKTTFPYHLFYST